MSGVNPTSVNACRSVSRFDPQTDTWSSSSTSALLSWVIADWAIIIRIKRTSGAKQNRPQIREPRVGIRASRERINIKEGMLRQNAPLGNDFPHSGSSREVSFTATLKVILRHDTDQRHQQQRASGTMTFSSGSLRHLS